MDPNNDGFLTKDELKSLFYNLNDEVTDEFIDAMMAIAKENQDGKVNFQEFTSAAQIDGDQADEIADEPKSDVSDVPSLDEKGAPVPRWLRDIQRDEKRKERGIQKVKKPETVQIKEKLEK